VGASKPNLIDIRGGKAEKNVLTQNERTRSILFPKSVNC